MVGMKEYKKCVYFVYLSTLLEVKAFIWRVSDVSFSFSALLFSSSILNSVFAV